MNVHPNMSTGENLSLLVVCFVLTLLGGLIGWNWLEADVHPYCTPPYCVSVERHDDGSLHYYSMGGREYTKAQVDAGDPR